MSTQRELSGDIVFVSGKNRVYDLTEKELECLLHGIQNTGYHKLAPGVYWTPDLELVEQVQQLVPKFVTDEAHQN
jgi:hypothetical protein